MKKKSGFILSLGVSAIAVFWLLRRVDLDEVQHALKQLDVAWWLLAVLIYLLVFFPRGLRWKLMLSTIKKVSFADSTQVVVLGYAANNLLPFRLGEIVRAYVMGSKNEISRITCLGSIGAERVIDGIVILCLLGISMISLANVIGDTEELKKIMFVGGILFLSAVFLLILVLILSDAILRTGKQYFPQFWLSVLEKAIQSLSFFRTKRILFQVLSLSIAVWLLEGAMFVLISWLMGLKNPVAMGYFCLGIVNLGILLPSAPGYIGVYQAASVFAFLSLGYSESAGLAYGLLVHLAQYIPITLAGIAIFFRFGYRFGDFYKSISGPS